MGVVTVGISFRTGSSVKGGYGEGEYQKSEFSNSGELSEGGY